MPDDVADPLEAPNRLAFGLNVALDHHGLRPAVHAYRLLPELVRDRVHDVILTLHMPVVFGNELLQGELARAGETALHLAADLTVGVAGTFDAGGKLFGMRRREADFGQTLGVWGVGQGFYLVLPLLGPSTPRDAVGRVVDGFMDPLGYFTSFFPDDVARTATETVDERDRRFNEINEVEKNALDYYATVRSLYLQERQRLVRQGRAGADADAATVVPDLP